MSIPVLEQNQKLTEKNHFITEFFLLRNYNVSVSNMICLIAEDNAQFYLCFKGFSF